MKYVHGCVSHIADVTGVYSYFATYAARWLVSQLMMSVELENLQPRMENDEEQNSEENKEERVGHNHWCLCRKCPSMVTAEESVCCDETHEATNKGSKVCITTHPSFERFCLDTEVL